MSQWEYVLLVEGKNEAKRGRNVKPQLIFQVNVSADGVIK